MPSVNVVQASESSVKNVSERGVNQGGSAKMARPMISHRARRSRSNQRRSKLKLYPAAASTALMRSP
jgi:hypothetical protein